MEYLYINSADLTFGTVSDATYTIKVPIYKKKVRLLSFNCPNNGRLLMTPLLSTLVNVVFCLLKSSDIPSN